VYFIYCAPSAELLRGGYACYIAFRVPQESRSPATHPASTESCAGFRWDGASLLVLTAEEMVRSSGLFSGTNASAGGPVSTPAEQQAVHRVRWSCERPAHHVRAPPPTQPSRGLHITCCHQKKE
jgi:hypothetical protein